MLGTRTFREGGVMIRWLGPLGRVWAPAIMSLHCFGFCMVVSWSFVHLLYINCGVIVRIIKCTFVFVVILWRIL